MFAIYAGNINEANIIITNSIGEEVIFTIESIINRRLRDTILDSAVFTILNKYIESKGTYFRDKLFKTFIKCKNDIVIQANRKELEPYPFSIIHDVLDYFNYDEILDYITTNRIIVPPSNLPSVYASEIEVDERGSREQTYLKSDYLELVTFITIMKATMGVIGEYSAVKEGAIGKSAYKEYILLNLYKTHSIYETPAFVKIYNSLEKLVERLFRDRDNSGIRIMEKNLSKDTMPGVLTALVVFQKLMLNNELLDSNLRNTVTKIYSFASDKLKLKNTASNINIKHTNSSGEGEDSESSLESYRTPTDITVGSMMEFTNEYSDLLELARNLYIKMPDSELMNIRNAFTAFNEHPPINEAFNIVCWICMDIPDPRALRYLEINEIINAFTCAFAYLWERGHTDVASIIACYAGKDSGFSVNISLRNKFDPVIKERIRSLYPNEKEAVINKSNSTINIVEESIGVICKSLMSYRLVNIMPEKYLDANNGYRVIKVPVDIRNRLALVVLDIHSDTYGTD